MVKVYPVELKRRANFMHRCDVCTSAALLAQQLEQRPQFKTLLYNPLDNLRGFCTGLEMGGGKRIE
ncbi:unnamed protein product [Sphenostylis stenocarpa]|uniref:Uncharacterized protein n=1 Tax=Sphenostylis stenocarpa TaxID=92480 RepID=A0AA86VAL7_9FABA|nr:unnamed protein product [Sphenostylis stenocarpa]